MSWTEFSAQSYFLLLKPCKLKTTSSHRQQHIHGTGNINNILQDVVVLVPPGLNDAPEGH